MNTDFVKAILYVYPTMGALEEAIKTSAENKAFLSYRTKKCAFDSCYEVAEEFLLAERIADLKKTLEGILIRLSDEERFLLEYRYFRRKKILKNCNAELACSERSYFRKQARLLEKILSLFVLCGVTEEYFFDAFENSLCIMKVYRAVREGGELRVCARREKRTLKFQGSKFSGGAVFLPCATNTATTRTATAASVMRTIWTAESPSEIFPPAAGASGSGRKSVLSSKVSSSSAGI